MKTRGTEIKIIQFINDTQVAEITVNGKAALWKAQGEFFNGHVDCLDDCRMESWIDGELFQNRQGKLVAGKVTSFLLGKEKKQKQNPTKPAEPEVENFEDDDTDEGEEIYVVGKNGHELPSWAI